MNSLSKLEDDLFSFNSELKGSAEFNAVMDFRLFMLNNENLDLKKILLQD